MDIKKLEVLLKVAETNSLTAAGNAMGFTQSGVSHLIKSLEEELGFQLLIRSKSGVQLTENCRDALPIIRDIVNGGERLNQFSSKVRGLDYGRVRVGAYTSPSVYWLPPIIEKFNRDYPNIRILFREGGTSDLSEELDEGTIDFALTTNPRKDHDWVPLCQDKYYVMLPQNHRFVNAESVPLELLKDEPLIVTTPGYDKDIDRILKKLGDHANAPYSCNDMHIIISMVRHGLGIGLISEMMLYGYNANIITREITPHQYRELGIEIPSLKNASIAVRTFIKYAEKFIRENEFSPEVR